MLTVHPVNIGRPKYTLKARYVADSQTLAVESMQVVRFAYSIDIDGCLILDLDADSVLVNLDYIAKRSTWRAGRLPSLGEDYVRADLRVGEETTRTESFPTLPVTAWTDEVRSTVILDLGNQLPREYDKKMIALSESCYAIVDARDRLLGFIVQDVEDGGM